MNIRILFILTLFWFGNGNDLFGQSSPTVDSLETKEPGKSVFKRIYDYFDRSNDVDTCKRFDISFIGGPHYSSDTKFGIGLVASGLYRIDMTDFTISPSNVSLYGDFTTSGAYTLGVGGNTIFPHDDYRLNSDMFFSSVPGRYWGIGYDKGNNKDVYTEYTKQEIQVKADFSKKVFNNTYIGIAAEVRYIRGRKFDCDTFLEGADADNTAVGGGLIVSYDSRDFIPNPERGLYIKLEQNFYGKLSGGSSSFRKTDLIARYYRKLCEGTVVAFDLQGIFDGGNVPWSMLPQIGGSYQMRGYYQGQYRDKKLIQTQIELRQHLYSRSGMVVWAGAGNVFPDFDDFKLKQTLPSFGIGYRWEFKNRVNVRIDFGVGKKQTGFYFNINEAF